MNSTADHPSYQDYPNGTECVDNHIWDWIHTVQPYYILAISVLGILQPGGGRPGAWCLPFWAVNVAHGFDWPFAAFLCPLVVLGIKINAYCSIYFMVLVSMDRYGPLVHPMSHGMMRRPKWAKRGCGVGPGAGAHHAHAPVPQEHVRGRVRRDRLQPRLPRLCHPVGL
ncbi:hypothetical protein NHX12_019021 [Muraenolepis orangiensis]|uniref:Uncharacterized protein n=1 Tax=Muraenolepis orangiensis TaxID=630683 RepID=A0A9Q0IWV2_9TELE|nr:hypothetical protein NHX12_019021 [Muraenolepis orangiensis]